MPADYKTMAADLDFFGMNRLRWRENTQLNFEIGSFFFSDGRESVVVESGGASSFRNSPVDRTGGKNVADASTQFAAQVKRSESTAKLRKMGSRGVQRNLAMLQPGSNGVMRQAKQLVAFLAGEFLAESHGRGRIML